VFELAYRFAWPTSTYEDGKNLKAPIMAAPQCALAFASELLLKCLLLIEIRKVDTTHSLIDFIKRSVTPRTTHHSAWEAKLGPTSTAFAEFMVFHLT